MIFDADFDKQKLSYHPREVARWLETGFTGGPIYTEMELCNRCNCHCTFCGVDHIVNNTGERISFDLARKILTGLHEIGNKSVMFSGHGEPLLHPQAVEIISSASRIMSTSVTTNGLALKENVLPLVDGLEWIRFSLNAGSAAQYATVQGTSPQMFDAVLANLAATVERKLRLGLKVTVGVQLVLLPENASNVLSLAECVRTIGADYFSVKPYSQHPLSSPRPAVDYEVYKTLKTECEALQTPVFRVVWRTGSVNKLGHKKPYGSCLGTQFLSFVSANGDIWQCNVFTGDQRFLIGNAAKETLREIWEGDRRKQVVRFIENELDLSACRDVCRMDECNRYLWRIKNPFPHDNFI